MTGQPDATQLDPWQLRCPNGHARWEPVNSSFWCSSCAESSEYDTDGSFEYVHDAKTGDKLDREDVRYLEQEAQRQQRRDGQQQAEGD